MRGCLCNQSLSWSDCSCPGADGLAPLLAARWASRCSRRARAQSTAPRRRRWCPAGATRSAVLERAAATQC
eukprot:6213024-Pleurochrysis_carterae.AAC.13